MSLMESRRTFLKQAALLGAGAVVASAAAACAPKAAPTAAPAAPAKAEPTVAQKEEAAPAPKAAIELRFMDRGDAIGEGSRHFSRVFEEQNPGITVKNESTAWGDLMTKVPTFVAGGTMADVAFQHTPLMLPELAAKGAWLDIEPLGERDNIDWDIYYPFALDACRLGPKGELVAGPESLHMGQNVCGWNKEMLDEFGFGTPSEDMPLDDFVELLLKIQGKMPEGSFAFHMGGGAWDMEALSRTFNSYIISKDRTQCGFSLEKTQDAHKWRYDLIHEYGVVGGREEMQQGQKVMFYAEQLAIILNSPNNMWVGFTESVAGKFNLASCQMPHGGGLSHGTTPSINAYVVYSKTKYPEESWALVRMLTSFDAAKWIAINQHIGPGSVVAAWNDPEVWAVNPIHEHTAKAFNKLTSETAGAIPCPLNTRRAEFYDYFDNEWQAMLYGDAPYDQAGVDKLQAELQAIMDKPLP
ncbi:MAG: extracellular solute-binding protein [Anaerolineae bacterium]|nr:extracellular solute-binding protein [Anaerolineae bacterium]